MDWIRRRPQTAAVAGVAAVLLVLVLVYLMVSSSSDDTTNGSLDLGDRETPTSEPTFGFPSATPSTALPTATATGGGTGGTGGGLPGGYPLGGQPIKSGTVDLPGLSGGSVAQNPAKHRIQLKVTSRAPIGTIGYYIPYSPDKQSGTVQNAGTSWSLRTVTYGDPDYARIYLRQGGSAAATITCQILVDGRVVLTKTTDGPYAYLICQA